MYAGLKYSLDYIKKEKDSQEQSYENSAMSIS